MKAIRILAIMLLFVPLLFAGCDDSDTSSSIYNFKVMSLGGGFTGTYIVDGGDIIEFTNKDKKTTENYYIFEQDLDNPTSINIRVDASNKPSQTQYLEVKIFQDKKEVESKSENKNVDNHLGFTLPYTFTSTDTTNTTDTTDTTN